MATVGQAQLAKIALPKLAATFQNLSSTTYVIFLASTALNGSTAKMAKEKLNKLAIMATIFIFCREPLLFIIQTSRLVPVS